MDYLCVSNAICNGEMSCCETQSIATFDILFAGGCLPLSSVCGDPAVASALSARLKRPLDTLCIIRNATLQIVTEISPLFM